MSCGAALLASLPPPWPQRLRRIAACAGGAWLVGGAVRDLLAGRPPGDLDVVVRGDVGAVASGLRVQVVKATRFGTATVAWPDGQELDLVQARREWYDAPAALPRVEPADLAADLARRDFTVNALALALHAAEWGELIDPRGGLADLRAGRLRVLHDGSFDDDPTRLYRAARYATRLGLRPTDRTARLIRTAVSAGRIDLLTPDRLRHELQRCLSEPAAGAQLQCLRRWGLLAAVQPGLRAPTAREVAAALRLAALAGVAPWRVLLLLGLPPDGDGAALAARLTPDLTLTAALQQAAAWRRRALPTAPRSALLRWIEGLPAELAVALAVWQPALRRPLAAWWRGGWPSRAELDGHALQALGVPSGPRLGRLLAGLRDARIDRKVRCREEERAWVLARLAAGDDADAC
ncbi:MAG: CCA tRNA nucleotidyltransferase [Fimbriimonadaceae bacterium]|nr:CCA tRNA nucleotidyltransferase [Fimbriimonadaceae bacterium]